MGPPEATYTPTQGGLGSQARGGGTLGHGVPKGSLFLWLGDRGGGGGAGQVRTQQERLQLTLSRSRQHIEAEEGRPGEVTAEARGSPLPGRELSPGRGPGGQNLDFSSATSIEDALLHCMRSN